MRDVRFRVYAETRRAAVCGIEWHSPVQRLAITITRRMRKMPRSGMAVASLGMDRSLHTIKTSPSVTSTIRMRSPYGQLSSSLWGYAALYVNR